MSQRRPNVSKLAKRRDLKGLVAALSYHDHIADSLDRVYDLGASVRRDAVLALASMPAGDEVDIGAALIVSLGDSSGEVRRAAATSLGIRREPRAIMALAKGALTWERLGYESAGDAALDALLGLAGPDAAETFVDVAVCNEADPARGREILTRLTDRGGEESATAALDRATATLSHASDQEVARHAADILVWLGANSVEPLLGLLQAPGEVRRQSIRALGELHDLRSTESLLALLSDDDPEVRRAAATALGQISDPRAIKPLLDTTADSDFGVREAALEAIQKFGPVTEMVDAESKVTELRPQ